MEKLDICTLITYHCLIIITFYSARHIYLTELYFMSFFILYFARKSIEQFLCLISVCDYLK